MPFIILAIGILFLILLITWAKLNAFLSFLIVCIFIGLANGMNIADIAVSVQKGIGDLLGSLVIIIGLGAMLGKLVAESGAAEKITSVLANVFGKKYIQWALMVTGFLLSPHIGVRSAPVTSSGGLLFALGAFAFVYNLWRTFNAADARHRPAGEPPSPTRTLRTLDE